jgi:uncharacterized protein (TIGR00299 family) protein
LDIHLDLIGGLAGDMFIAALLDAWPEHETRVREAIEATRGPRPVSCVLVAHRDSVLRGSRFEVLAATTGTAAFPAQRAAEEPQLTWQQIRLRLLQAPIAEGVRRHALEIFQLLAVAEGYVHGVAVESVQFHEVGAWDSIADIVGAATLIDAVGATRWTASAVPLGSGRVATAHGMMAVPTPATVQLLLGLPTVDDGVAGERVTPTGAAILRHLLLRSAPVATHRPQPRTLRASGTGFGSRTLPGLSNHVRALCFEDTQGGIGQVVRHPQAQVEHRRLHVVEFEVDDQAAEDLAIGLDRMRAQDGVLDVTQTAVFGKKGRMTTHVRVLTRNDRLEEVVAACFEETTTIGLRHHSVEGIALKRMVGHTTVDGHTVRVKIVDRSGQLTAKTEADDVGSHARQQHRASLRQRAESQILSQLADSLDA